MVSLFSCNKSILSLQAILASSSLAQVLYIYTYILVLWGKIGMESNRERHHGKMECLEQIVQSLQTLTGHTISKAKIRSEPSSTSLRLKCTELPAVSVASTFTTDLSFQSHTQFPLKNSPCSLVIGTKLATRFENAPTILLILLPSNFTFYK